MPDHIYLLFEAPSKYAPSQLAGIIKGLSSKKMRAEFLPETIKYIWEKNTLWGRGYYIASVADQVTTGVVKEYIKNQKKYEKHSVSQMNVSQTQM